MKLKKYWPEFIFIFFIISMLLLPNLIKIPPHDKTSGPALSAPSREHILGTDDLGMDLFSQICHGARITFALSFGAAFLSGILGSLLGIFCGYQGGIYDKTLVMLIDISTGIPDLPLIIVLGALLGGSLRNIIIVISLLSWSGPARISRSQTLKLKTEKYIVLSKAYGGKFSYIFKRHLLKPIFPVMMSNVIRIMNRAVLTESSLAFLGLGDPLSKSWGMIITRAMSFPNIYFTPFYKWWLIPPILMLVCYVTYLAMLGRRWENFRKSEGLIID